MKQRVWITWETQRRSISLARRLGAEYFNFDDGPGRRFRYLVCSLMTIPLLLRSRGQIVFVQNPSMVLAALACALKPLCGYTLVVDRHSNFLIDYPLPYSLKQRLFLRLSRTTIRKADVTIITNPALLERVEKEGGRGFILQDPYPDLPRLGEYRRNSPLEVLFVSSWSDDEPIAQTVEACRLLRGKVKVFISGRMKKEYAAVVRDRPDNFIPTGFLPDEEYLRLLNRVDCVMAVTTAPHILVCGAYEGIALGKPLILGNSHDLREYFTAGAVYTDGSVADLVEKIQGVDRGLDRLREEVAAFYRESSRSWDEKLSSLDRWIGEFTSLRTAPGTSPP